jgi:hypothetical protein
MAQGTLRLACLRRSLTGSGWRNSVDPRWRTGPVAVGGLDRGLGRARLPGWRVRAGPADQVERFHRQGGALPAGGRPARPGWSGFIVWVKRCAAGGWPARPGWSGFVVWVKRCAAM